MGMPLPVHRDPLAQESNKLPNPAPLGDGLTNTVTGDVASATDEDAGVTSAMILSLVDKLPTAPAKEPAAELARLEEENRRLRTLLDQARERLQLMERETARWRQREQEYEALLEEKSELIRQLHQELQLVKEHPASDRRVPREEELIALEQELLREREQLKRDEEQLMAEIRQMEVALSRERADLARQRNELQRLHQQIQTELEIASREATLRERLGPLYELHAELQRRYFGEVRSSRRPLSHCSLPEMPTAKPGGQQATSRSPHPASHPGLARNPATPGIAGSAQGNPTAAADLPNSASPQSVPVAGPTRSLANPANASPAQALPKAASGQADSTETPAKPGFFRRLFGLD